LIGELEGDFYSGSFLGPIAQPESMQVRLEKQLKLWLLRLMPGASWLQAYDNVSVNDRVFGQ
jgi:hypothetical protein